ncbi:MAG: hypothetical protein V1659_00795 [Candidatus Woesearchaeota archaeon]
MKCMAHNLYAETKCSWCSTPICVECIRGAAGKKYCPRCAAKLGVSRVTQYKKELVREMPELVRTKKIMNIDTSLDNERLSMAKEYVTRKTSGEDR